MCTAPITGQTWIVDVQGKILSASISNYSENGERNLEWIE